MCALTAATSSSSTGCLRTPGSSLLRLAPVTARSSPVRSVPCWRTWRSTRGSRRPKPFGWTGSPDSPAGREVAEGEEPAWSKNRMTLAFWRADADGHPHPHQYPALGFCVAGLPDLAGRAIAAAEHAADLADADRALGVLSDGLVAAGDGARQGDRAASR